MRVETARGKRFEQQALQLKEKLDPLKLQKVEPVELEIHADPVARQKTFRQLFEEKRGELREASEDMESMLFHQMLKSMRQTKFDFDNDGESDYFGEESHATQTFKSMLDEEYSKKMAHAGVFGLAEKVFQDQANGMTQQLATVLAQDPNRVYPTAGMKIPPNLRPKS